MKRLLAFLMVSAIAFPAIIEVTVTDTMNVVANYINMTNNGTYIVKMNVENPGSVSCPVQAKLVAGKSRIWSKQELLNPGDIAVLEIPYFTSKEENVSVYLHYCDEYKRVWNFTAEPSKMEFKNISLPVRAKPGELVVPEGWAAMPYGNPQNWIIESSPTGGELKIIEGPKPGDNITLVLSNGTAYTVEKVQLPKPMPPWVLPFVAFIIGIGVGYAGGSLGKVHEGRKNPERGKGKPARKVEARHGRSRHR